MAKRTIAGARFELGVGEAGFPEALALLPRPPQRLYVIGNVDALRPGLAVVGARKATPYGLTCAARFSRLAAEKGVVIISGGARGCDAEAHRAALRAGGQTVAFLGGGCDEVYPRAHFGLFQDIVDAGGAVVSENDWGFAPVPYAFRERNRLIAGLADAVLIVEAGLPSGTFSTADAALEAGKDVLVVPGSISSPESRGSNRLLYQGAAPVVDDESFEDALFRLTGTLKRPREADEAAGGGPSDPIIAAVLASPSTTDELMRAAGILEGGLSGSAVMEKLVEAQAAGIIARRPDGKWGPAVPR